MSRITIIPYLVIYTTKNYDQEKFERLRIEYKVVAFFSRSAGQVYKFECVLDFVYFIFFPGRGSSNWFSGTLPFLLQVKGVWFLKRGY